MNLKRLLVFLNIIQTTLNCAATSSITTTTAATSTCTSCVDITVRTGSGIGTDGTVTQTIGTNAAGCSTLTVTCTGGTSATDTVLFFYATNGTDVGTKSGTTTTTQTFTCANGVWFIDGQVDGIGSVECVYATA